MKTLLFLVSFCLLTTCGDDSQEPLMACEYSTTPTDDINNIVTDNYSIQNVEIIENCLEITLGSSGCDGESWLPTMYLSDALLVNNLIQYQFALQLQNNEECDAYFIRVYTFDIIDLSDSNLGTEIQLAGWDEVITIS